MTTWLPFLTGSGGALAALAIVAYLFLAGKLHSDAEYTKLSQENDDLKRALETERQANNELARAGGVTNKLIGALVDLAADRHEHDRQLGRQRSPAREATDLSPGDLGLL